MQKRFDLGREYLAQTPWFTFVFGWTLFGFGLILLFSFIGWMPQNAAVSIREWLNEITSGVGPERKSLQFVSIAAYVGLVLVHFGQRVEICFGRLHLVLVMVICLALALGLKFLITPAAPPIETLLLFNFLLAGTILGDAVVIRLSQLDLSYMRSAPRYWMLWVTLWLMVFVAGQTGPRMISLAIGTVLGAGMLWFFYRNRLTSLQTPAGTQDIALSNNT